MTKVLLGCINGLPIMLYGIKSYIAELPLWLVLILRPMSPSPKDQIGSELQVLINKRGREPLHHALLREAKSILLSNPQSAFVITVSALEVGAKYFLSRKVPESEWLM